MIRTIDDIDKKILCLLIENAKLNNKEIAGILEISQATVHLRIKKLLQKGVIKGSSISLDYSVIGHTLSAYIGIIVGKTNDSHKIMKRIVQIPEVTMANITTGQFGAFCKVRCKNTNHLKEIIFKINSIDGIQRTESMISLEETINDKSRLFKYAFGLES